MWRPDMPDKPTNSTFPAVAAARTGIVVLALLIVFAAFITSSHFHFATDASAGCSICKCAQDQAGGSNHSAAPLDPQEILEDTSIANHLVSVYAVYIDLKKNRAPPV